MLYILKCCVDSGMDVEETTVGMFRRHQLVGAIRRHLIENDTPDDFDLDLDYQSDRIIVNVFVDDCLDESIAFLATEYK